MLRLAATLFLVALLGAPATALERPVVKESRYSAGETADRLQAIVEENGATVVARVDHAAGAQKAGMELEPTILVIFGNPKLGTPLMQEARPAGLDLPLKVLIWEDGGRTSLAYLPADSLGARWGLQDQDELLAKISGALDAMTDAAAQGD